MTKRRPEKFYFARKAGDPTPTQDLTRHDCFRAGKKMWWEYDAQGIEVARVCSVCRKAKLAQYRPEILSGYDQSDVDEPIEPEDAS